MSGGHWRFVLRCLLATGLLLTSSRLAVAQTESLVTRVAIVNDATVCACTTNGESAPRLRDLLIVGIGKRYRLGTSGSGAWTFDYAPELIPLLVSKRTADERLDVWQCGPGQYCGKSDDFDVWSVTSVGAGILPIGGLLTWHPVSALQFRGRVSAGGVLLTRPVPLAQGTKFNFVAEGAASLGLRVTRSLIVTGGMVLNHISNGGLSDVNLGMDSRMLELGAVITR